MSNLINTIDKLINDLVKLIEETDDNRAYQRFGSLVDELTRLTQNLALF